MIHINPTEISRRERMLLLYKIIIDSMYTRFDAAMVSSPKDMSLISIIFSETAHKGALGLSNNFVCHTKAIVNLAAVLHFQGVDVLNAGKIQILFCSAIKELENVLAEIGMSIDDYLRTIRPTTITYKK